MTPTTMRLRLLLACLLLSGSLHAAEITDLGEGLAYLRVEDAATSALPSIDGSYALDLRRATATSPADASRLRSYLVEPGSVRFVLVSADTAAAVLTLLETRSPSVITLGPAGTIPEPDINVVVSLDEDRRAYSAHTEGTPLELLVRPDIPKPRRDEAALLRNRANGGNGPAEPEEPPPADTAAPLVDAVLQRAVHLHHGLKALGRL